MIDVALIKIKKFEMSRIPKHIQSSKISIKQNFKQNFNQKKFNQTKFIIFGNFNNNQIYNISLLRLKYLDKFDYIAVLQRQKIKNCLHYNFKLKQHVLFSTYSCIFYVLDPLLRYLLRVTPKFMGLLRIFDCEH